MKLYIFNVYNQMIWWINAYLKIVTTKTTDSCHLSKFLLTPFIIILCVYVWEPCNSKPAFIWGIIFIDAWGFTNNF